MHADTEQITTPTLTISLTYGLDQDGDLSTNISLDRHGGDPNVLLEAGAMFILRAWVTDYLNDIETCMTRDDEED